ncbi:3-oxoacyl-ACP reductase FabG [Thioalkalivibrio sulfidiphilus]|uniref:3-oxoacyl-ACP reductase FabG n=1 Tax=Thioalkalivibrio sulfidiphilus TaxID=1033854 RepID=UPI0003607B9B|nr:3-oxoacyl-ACP reductase FabG [Thioalkalivibrio sulfidiphilus]
MNLENEIALVTGASRGIGKAIAMALAEQGATVVGTATSESGAEAITAYLREAGLKGRGMALNVTDAEAVEAAIKQISDDLGGISILVNNAGITRDNLMMRMKDEEWDDIIQTNLTAVWRVTRGVLRGMMKARKGRIINVGSVVGSSGNAGQTNYAAAKAGLLGLGKSLAREVGSRGITVNTVAPGFIDTDMTRGLPQAQRDALLGQIPLGRLGRPEEIASVVAFLASPAAAYITGETLHINGGMYMA